MCKYGVKPFITDFKDQFRSVLSYFVKELNAKGYCYIHNPDEVKDIDASMYEFMQNRNIIAKYGIAIEDKNKNVIGFICDEFIGNADNADDKVIDRVLKQKKNIIEYLLNS